jgi:hypothetical protein
VSFRALTVRCCARSIPNGADNKAADKHSAYIKCLEELKSGNGEFRLAASQTKEKLMSYDMPRWNT